MTDTENRTSQSEDYRGRRSNTSGPLIPIILIATLVFAVIDNTRSDASGRVPSQESTFEDTAFLGGFERKYSSSTFRGGQAKAVMGGIDLDFRDAIIEGDEATLEVTAIMGGVEIRIPRDWTIVNRVTPVMGGVKDRTNSTGETKRLVIEGTVLMGGLDIRN